MTVRGLRSCWVGQDLLGLGRSIGMGAGVGEEIVGERMGCGELRTWGSFRLADLR